MKNINVAVGIIRHPQRGIFITQRAKNVHMGGFWEFPGGKIEPNETPKQALKREIWEETHIIIEKPTPFLFVEHIYPDFVVNLHTFLVECWKGEPYGREGQPQRWISQYELLAEDFPVANRIIVEKLLTEDKKISLS